MEVAIAGGGIAGLTAAIALARRGFAVDVHERAAEPREVGAGIQLSPNAMAILHRLGMDEALAPALTEPEAIEIRNGRTGALLTRIPLGAQARNRYGAPYKVVHRADLLGALLLKAAEAGVRLHFGAEVEKATPHRDGVSFTAGGTELTADLLVCADGVFSRLRTHSFGLPGAQRLDKIAWRGTLAAGSVPTAISRDVTGLWLGPAAHLVHYPVSGGAALNVVLISSALHETGVLPVAAFAPAIRELAEAVPSWMSWPLNVVDARQPWVKGRMVLIGDAAHSMAPSAAQGGAQAIEDAAVLAACLGSPQSGNAEQALARFQALRRPRTTRIARTARRNLSIYNMSGLAAYARDQVIAALPPEFHLARLDWIYRPAGEEIP